MENTSKPQTIGLGMIVAPRAEDAHHLEACLRSVYQFVDEIAITITGYNKQVEEVARKYDAKISRCKWDDDFAAARNFNREQVKSDWYLWLDADDTLDHPERLQQMVAMAGTYNGFYFLYKYNFDAHGNCIDQHWKIQLLKNDDRWSWKGAIHEDPLPEGRGANWVQTFDVTRIHHSTGERSKASGERNVRILLRERERNPDDPRIMYYLGRAYVTLGEYQQAVDLLLQYLAVSGWDEERYMARMLIGEAFVKTSQFDEALRAYNDAILEKEEYALAYIQKASIYLMRGEWNKALYNYKTSIALQDMSGATFFNPMTRKRDVWLGIAVSYLNLGVIKEARQALNIALKEDPSSKEGHELKKIIDFEAAKFAVTDAYVVVAKALRDSGEESKILPLIHSFPKLLQDNEIYLQLKHTYLKPKKWKDKSIAVFCGSSPESWKPGDENGKGIGGSETAVIKLTEQLAKLGWDVTVFNQCDVGPDGEVINGVKWENYWKFNTEDEFDVLWVWRIPEMFDYNLKARFTVLDLHDVMHPADLTDERVDNIDLIFVKTNYHRSLYPKVADEKFAIVGNGIDLSRWDIKSTRPIRKHEMTGPNQEGHLIDTVVERKPHRFIYSSSPNRGLELILKIWPMIRKAIPDAELHVFYGWETFYKLEKHNPERVAWMKNIQRKVQETEGVVDHGRVGQKQLAEEQLKSAFWLYPTNFPEIDCITAKEAQAAGCIPLTSGYAALAESQRCGLSFKGDTSDPVWQKQFVQELLRWVTDEELQKAERARALDEARAFSWEAVAKEWDGKLSETLNAGVVDPGELEHHADTVRSTSHES